MHLEENKKEMEREQSKIGTNIKEDGLMVIASLVVQRLGFDPWVGKIPWRRKWQPTLVLLLEESHGGRSLVGYSPWGCKESDMTERLHFTLGCFINDSEIMNSKEVQFELVSCIVSIWIRSGDRNMQGRFTIVLNSNKENN